MPYVLMAVLKMRKLVRKVNLEANTLSGYHISLILLKNKMGTPIALVRPGIVEIKLGVLKMLTLCSPLNCGVCHPFFGFGHRHPRGHRVCKCRAPQSSVTCCVVHELRVSTHVGVSVPSFTLSPLLLLPLSGRPLPYPPILSCRGCGVKGAYAVL